jgi:hypothetical protein
LAYGASKLANKSQSAKAKLRISLSYQGMGNINIKTSKMTSEIHHASSSSNVLMHFCKSESVSQFASKSDLHSNMVTRVKTSAHGMTIVVTFSLKRRILARGRCDGRKIGLII